MIAFDKNKERLELDRAMAEREGALVSQYHSPSAAAGRGISRGIPCFTYWALRDNYGSS